MRLFLTLFMIQAIILLGACQQQEKREALDKQDGRQHVVRVSDSTKKRPIKTGHPQMLRSILSK